MDVRLVGLGRGAVKKVTKGFGVARLEFALCIAMLHTWMVVWWEEDEEGSCEMKSKEKWWLREWRACRVYLSR